MPYVKFDSKREMKRFRDSLERYIDEIVEETNHVKRPWKASLIRDENLGLIYFMTDNLYSKIEAESLKFEVIKDEDVKSTYVDMLRAAHPDLGY